MATMDIASRSSIDDEALYWVVVNQVDGAADDERDAFKSWLRADARHEAAYRHAQEVWSRLGEAAELKAMAASVDQSAARPQRKLEKFRRALNGLFAAPTRIAAAAAAIGATILAAAVLLNDPLAPSPESYATATAEVRTIALPDGSAVDLAPESRIEVAYSNEARRIELAAGEAFFEVAKDAARPFIVAADGAEVRAVGTKFNVHRGPAGVTVAVAEGAVDISQKEPLAAKLTGVITGSAETPEQRLRTGELLVSAPNLKRAEIVKVSPQRAGAWRAGHLFYPDNTLREVIADVNRYSRVPVALASKELGDLRIAAAFPTTQIDDMLNGIEGVLPVTVDRSNKERIVIRARGG